MKTIAKEKNKNKWQIVTVDYYHWTEDKWQYSWTNAFGLLDFADWVKSIRNMKNWDDKNRIIEKQAYDGTCIFILKKDNENFNKYVAKISHRNPFKKRRTQVETHLGQIHYM